jgi:hypothetical protein
VGAVLVGIEPGSGRPVDKALDDLPPNAWTEGLEVSEEAESHLPGRFFNLGLLVQEQGDIVPRA